MTTPYRVLDAVRNLPAVRNLAAVREEEPLTKHAETHEAGGTDEINLAGLSGLTLADLPDIDLDDLHDVNVPSPTDGYALTYDAASGLWIASKPIPANHASSHEPDASDELTGFVKKAGDTGLGRHFRRGVEDDYLMIGGGKTVDVGGQVELFGGNNATRPGDASIMIGDLRPGFTPDSKYRVYYLSSGGATVIFTLDKSGNITSIGTIKGVNIDDHHTRHEKDGADEISVAGLSGVLADEQKPNLAEADFGVIMDFTNWTESVSGSGTTIRGFRLLQLVTGTTANSTAIAYFHWYPDPTDFDRDINLYILYHHSWAGSTNFQAWIKFGAGHTAGDPTGKAIGFRVDMNALRGIVHDGTDLHVIDLSTTLGIGTAYDLTLKFTAGSQIEWFVNGVSKGTSTDIPTGARSSDLTFAVTNGADATMNIVTAPRWAYKLEWFYL